MTTYQNAIEATKVWAGQHHVIATPRGFEATDTEARAELPEYLRCRPEKTALVWRGWSGKGAKVRTWGELARILIQNRVITPVPPPAHYTLGRTRYALAT